jgi:hypothetical protein
MNQTHLPRFLFVPLILLIVATFFIGTVRTFIPVHARSNAMVIPAVTQISKTPSTTPDKTAVTTPVATSMESSSGSADIDTGVTPTPTEEIDQGYADTTGIIALAILMVVVILVGVAWGGRKSRMNKVPKK